MKKALVIFSIMIFAVFCQTITAEATEYVVWDTVLSIYGQSEQESSAHLIRSSKGIYNNGMHPWCGDRAYILLTDKALYATALASSMAEKHVNFIYEDAAPSKTARDHITFGCKVISIFW
jgi:hypothetical protein